jgi:glycosyltransferase involved in cell wall biosynthesis
MLGKVVILHYAAPPIVGGVESTIYHHARLLAEDGYSVEVVAGRGGNFHPQVEIRIVPEVDSRNEKVLTVGKSLARGEVTGDFSALRDQVFESLRPILLGAQACIVHNALTLHKNLPLTSALRLLSDEKITKFIAWCHDFAWQDSLYTPDLHPGYPWDLLRNAWPGVAYVVVSEHRLERLGVLLNLPKEEIRVVTPGVDIEQFLRLEPLTTKLVDRLNLLAATPLLLLPARITRRKNIEFGVRVVAALIETMPETMLVITGPPGPHNPKNMAYLEKLLALRQELGVSSNVQFLYQQTEDDAPLNISDAVVADLYRLADALFFPSKQEGFGIPVLEAGLARLPVFAADIPPVRESAGRWANRFDPNGDPALVAKQIADYLKANPGYHLKQRVINQFSWQRIVRDNLLPLIQMEN